MDSLDFESIDLVDLIERLRLAGFKVGVDRHINAQNLLLLLASRGRLGDAPDGLATWLAPVLCSSPEEQAIFHNLFGKWSEGRREKRPSRTTRRGLLHKKWLLAVAPVVSAGALIVIVMLWRTPSPPVPPDTTPPTNITRTTAGGLWWLVGGAAGLLALIIGGQFLKSPRVSRLVRWRADENLSLERLSVKGAGRGLFSGLHALRRQTSVASDDVDVNSTVDATARNAGWFTPVYSRKRTTPEYLLLVDSMGYGDQQAELGSTLYDRLREECVSASRYFFSSDPRLCRGDDPTAPHITLEDLTSLYPEHDLIMVGDGEGLLDPLTGRPATWLSPAARWQTRVLLTPMPRRLWGRREKTLAYEGFLVIPANSSGLVTLAEKNVTRASAEPERAGRRPHYPEELKQRPERWLMDEEPAPDTFRRLRFQLRLFLGAEGYRWLCACAVFPVLLWDLTLYLGRGLEPDSSFEESLSKLVQLPWFRHGVMPDWLRLKLINDLEPVQEQKVRQALNDLLVSCNEEGVCDPLELEVLILRNEPRARLARGNRILRDYVKAHPESRLRDYLLLTFMSGRRPDRLAVDVPAEVLDRLIVRDGPEWLIHLLDAALLSLACYVFWGVAQSPSGSAVALGLMTVICDIILIFQLHQWSFSDVTRVSRSALSRLIPEKVSRPAEKHPKQLYVLSAAQMLAQFSYNSTSAILLLYLTGNAAGGFGWTSNQALRLYMLLGLLLILSTLLGGWLGDRKFFGYRRALVVGGLFLVAGYVLLVPHSATALFAAMACIGIGDGLFTTNASVMVGEFYAEGSRLKDRAYTIFQLGLNIAPFIGPIAGMYVSEKFGFGPACAVSVGSMLLSLLTLFFLKGLPRGERCGVLPGGAAREGVPASRRVFVLTVTCAVAALFWMLALMADPHLSIFTQNSIRMGVSSTVLNSFDLVWLITLALPLVWFWGWLDRRGKEPSTPTKMTLGLALMACSYYVMALASRVGGDVNIVSPVWLISVYFIRALGKLMVVPMVWSMVSNVAPRRVRGLAMGGLFIVSVLGSTLSYISAYWNSWPHSNVFALLGTTALAAAAVLLALGRRLKRAITAVGEANAELETKRE
jgi:dipeptide/tripeptide permease